MAACEARGWRIVEEFIDNGISGAKGRDKRPGFDRLLKLNGAGCDLYLDRQAIDTTTPAGRALFQMLGVFAEFERSIIQERIHAGIARARVIGTKSGKPIGRARIAATKEAAIRTSLAKGKGILRTARECRTGASVVQRIKAEMARDDAVPP
jgi:DNA invertase Pin-like site-specific DNA recombinase